jgi:Asp-tRNA(Asn)/Glu-tRNA(Gln) amidotransferase A subunit family amidase
MGVTLLAPAWADRRLLALARRLEMKAPDAPFALASRARVASAEVAV